MDVVEVLTRLGGVADADVLVGATSRAHLARSVQRGQVVRLARGRYALPHAEPGVARARALSGVVSHLTAALWWGWPVKTPPDLPMVTVPAKRRVGPARREGVVLHWRDLDPPDVHAGRVTSRVRTVLDCARDLPFDDALAVADSALREGVVTSAALLEAASVVRTRGRVRALRVARSADERAANPFESVLRALSLDVPGLQLEPQVLIDEHGLRYRPDLVDRRRRLVVEAESFEFHGHRRALLADCRRYTHLGVRGWTVLRFAWEDVMHRPAYVRACFEVAAGAAVGQEIRALRRP